MSIFAKKKETGRGFVPFDRVEELASNNTPESDIIESLRNEGFSAQEIDQAFTEYLKYSEPQVEEQPAQEESEPVFEEEEEEELVVSNPGLAPLFVKLEKYDKILVSLEELRNTMAVIKNAFTTLNELERLRHENMKITENTIKAVDKRLAALDAEFLRPPSKPIEENVEKEEPLSENYMVGLEGELSDLKNQIDRLKGELKAIV